MHTYKSIYIYAYMLCTNKFVEIFVVIVWKTRLNTLKKLKRNYLRKLFKKIIWERSFEKNHLRESFKENHLRKKDEEEIFDKRKRDEILKQTTRLLKFSINKTYLFDHVWYLSFFNILFRLFLSNIFSSFSLLSQMILSNDLLE
jgi:hypothetical protein